MASPPAAMSGAGSTHTGAPEASVPSAALSMSSGPASVAVASSPRAPEKWSSPSAAAPYIATVTAM